MVIIMSIFPSEVTETQKREVVAQYSIGFSNHGAARGKFQKGSLKKKNNKKKQTTSLDSQEILRKKTKLSNHLQLGALVSKLKKHFFFSSQELKLQYY